jgi:hypothetical protein
MVKFSEYYIINNAIIINMPYKHNNLPVIVDKNVFDFIGKDHDFYVNDLLSVHTRLKVDNDIIDIPLHEIVMKYNEKYNGVNGGANGDINEGINGVINKPIIHKNRINLDNRYENLMYDTTDKKISKNLEKKERNIDLTGAGINANKLPSFVWYLNPDSTHGERFMVKLDTINWKSPSSKDLSLRYKLEATKQFLRNKINENPELIKKFSLNGDLNDIGLQLRRSYYNLIHQVGGGKYKKYQMKENNSTLNILKQDLKGLTAYEKLLLKS